jgi:hypothetical protein
MGILVLVHKLLCLPSASAPWPPLPIGTATGNTGACRLLTWLAVTADSDDDDEGSSECAEGSEDGRAFQMIHFYEVL